MLYECARCHERFEVDGEAHACPACKAEAGLEAHPPGLPFPMRAFGGVVALAFFLGLTGTAYGIFGSDETRDQDHWRNSGVPARHLQHDD